MKQNEVVGKTVIAADGNRVGDVKEVAFSLEGRLGFVVATPEGAERTVPFEAVQAVGEFIVLRGDAAPPAGAPAPAAAVAPVAPAPAARAVASPATPQPAPATADAAAAGSCAKCGKSPRAGAKFCNHCGHALAAAGV